jgi:CrcB protein
VSALTWIGVALVGGVGALARVAVDGASVRRLTQSLTGPGTALAVGTLVVNLSGAFVLGMLDGLALSGDASLLVATAGMGAYTTFSTWMLQSAELLHDGSRRAALANLAVSLLAGFGAVLLGRLIGTALCS